MRLSVRGNAAFMMTHSTTSLVWNWFEYPPPWQNTTTSHIRSATSTEFRMEGPGLNGFVLSGRGFTYDGTAYPSGGVITGWQDINGNGGSTTISGLNLPADILLTAIYSSDGVYEIDVDGPAGERVVPLFLSQLGGADHLFGGDRNDSFSSYGGQDVVSGRGGSDYIDGGKGGDRLYGGASLDHLYGGDGDDTLNGGADADYVLGGNGHDVIHGGAGDDRSTFFSISGLFGGTGHDTIHGGAGHDLLEGGDGRDSLAGGAGQDTLIGDAGKDVLTGGAGADTFAFRQASDTTTGLKGRDIITDFNRSHGDKIAFAMMDADSRLEGHQPFVFIEKAGFSGAGAELRYKTLAEGVLLLGDINGDRRADFAVMVENITTIFGDDLSL